VDALQKNYLLIIGASNKLFFIYDCYIRCCGSESGIRSIFYLRIRDLNVSFFPDNQSVLRIRDVYPGSDFFLSRIPVQNSLPPGSRIRIKNLSILTPKKWFLSSRKYDQGCSSRIPDPDADFLPIPDPKSRGHKRHRIRIRNTVPYPYFRELINNSKSILRTVRPDLIYMRVVPLDRPGKGHQLYHSPVSTVAHKNYFT